MGLSSRFERAAPFALSLSKLCLFLFLWVECYDFPPFVLMTRRMTHQTLGLMTPPCLPFSPILLDGRHLLCTNTYSAMTCLLCTCITFLLAMFVDPHVYKRLIVHHRNSKRVLFCTNTSRRRTCPFLILCIPILGEYPISNPLSPERLPSDRDLAIHVTTTHNIRTRFPNQRTPWTPTSPHTKVAKLKRSIS